VKNPAAAVYTIVLIMMAAFDFFIGYRLYSRGVFIGSKYVVVRADDKSAKFEVAAVKSVTIKIYNDVSAKRDKAEITVLKKNNLEYAFCVECFFMSKSGMFPADLSAAAVDKLEKKAASCPLIKIEDKRTISA